MKEKTFSIFGRNGKRLRRIRNIHLFLAIYMIIAIALLLFAPLLNNELSWYEGLLVALLLGATVGWILIWGGIVISRDCSKYLKTDSNREVTAFYCTIDELRHISDDELVGMKRVSIDDNGAVYCKESDSEVFKFFYSLPGITEISYKIINEYKGDSADE